MALITGNKHDLRSYTIIETWDAGIRLTGGEVKSIRLGRASLTGSFISIHAGELWLRKCYIPPYQIKNTPKSYNPYTDRKLLLKKTEIRKLTGLLATRGYTCIATGFHTTSRHTIAVSVALVKHMNKHDNRTKIRDRDLDREIRREIKTALSL
jgi:SsrA-binding protein